MSQEICRPFAIALTLCALSACSRSPPSPSQSILSGCVAVQHLRPDAMDDVSINEFMNHLREKGLTVSWVDGADKTGIIRSRKDDQLTAKSTAIDFAVQALPPTEEFATCRNGKILVTEVAVDGSALTPYEAANVIERLVGEIASEKSSTKADTHQPVSAWPSPGPVMPTEGMDITPSPLASNDSATN